MSYASYLNLPFFVWRGEESAAALLDERRVVQCDTLVGLEEMNGVRSFVNGLCGEDDVGMTKDVTDDRIIMQIVDMRTLGEWGFAMFSCGG